MANQVRRRYSRRRGDSYESPYGGYGYGYTTPGEVFEEPYAITQWTEVYVPTVNAGGKRPVIYVAAPLPAGNPFGGFGGVGGFGGGSPFIGY